MKIAVNTAKLLRNVPLPDEIAHVHDEAAVIDIGSDTTRIGFSGDDAPRVNVPTIVGRETDKGPVVDCFKKAYRRRDVLQIGRVMERGIVTDWDGMEQLWRHISELLGMAAEPCPVLITESALVPKEQRETMVEMLFETIGIQKLYFSLAPVLALYSSGRTSGIVVEMGEGTCHTVPIFEGFGLFHSVLQLDFGGADLTMEVGKRLTEAGALFAEPHRLEIWRYLKELYCPMPQDRAAYTALTNESSRQDPPVTHTLPDGQQVTLGNWRFGICESLFDPSVLGKDDLKGIQHLVVDSIRKCDADTSPTMFSNVVLSGGTSLFNGLPDRLSRELQEAAPSEKIRLTAATERRNASWVGGSILASLPTFQDMWVTKEEYQEMGADVKKCIAHRNCF